MKQLMPYYYQMRHNYIYQILIQTPNQILKECFIKKNPTHIIPLHQKKPSRIFPPTIRVGATHTQQSQINKKMVGGGTNKRTGVRESRSNTLWNRNHKENQHISRIYRVTTYQFPLLPTLHRQTEKNRYCFRGVVRVIP